MSTHIKILLTLIVLLALVIGILTAGFYWVTTAYVKVDGILYDSSLTSLDLRGQKISPEHQEHLQQAFPGCPILWDVDFQGGVLSSDTEQISISRISEEDIHQLQYLQKLKKVDASACTDYDGLLQLQKAYPRLRVDYTISLDGIHLATDTEQLDFSEGKGTFQELMGKLKYLPRMKSIHFLEPQLTPEELAKLQETYPEISLSWEKTVFGKRLSCDTEELDISKTKFSSIEEIEKQTDYLKGLKKLVMCDTGLPYDDIAAYRERSRDRFKVVFNVKVGQFNVRTDETWFMPTKFHKDVKDRDVQNLRYCEDMICIDLGHNVIKNVGWLEGTPHLKYLIIADGPLQDVTPIGTLKELKFLEVFMTDIRDISPLVGCTALEDLNVARIPADLRPLGEMTWLKNLWASGGWVDKEEEAFLRKALPNTRIDTAHHHDCCGRGWRTSQNYYDMRDILGMPYLP